MYQLTENELSNLQTAGNYKALDIALFALAAGVLVTVVITMSTVDIANARTFALFVALASVACVCVVFFGIRAFIAWRSANRQLQIVKRNGAA